MRVVALLALCAGCSFNPERAGADDTAGVDAGDDGNPVRPPAPLHLAPEDGRPGDAPLTLDGTVTIDTSVPSISVALPDGNTLDVKPQLGGGPELAVLHVGTLTVTADADVRIIGARPLAIVAGGAVDIAGLLDAGADRETPGPGGEMPGSGIGAGLVGGHGSNASDTGGGGGGYGAAGANGGAITGCTVALGSGGAAFGDDTITQLVGGAGGGGSSGTSCTPDVGGAGGGALQISATIISIVATGRINAGGGGGDGGTDCGVSDVNSGAGGGAGGAIVLQAASITNAGIVAANGGGGGGSSSTSNGSATAGENGAPSLVPAGGGPGPRAQGGSGGVASMEPTAGGNAACGGNSAGGGGAVGRIAVSAGAAGAGTFSPLPNKTLPP